MWFKTAKLHIEANISHMDRLTKEIVNKLMQYLEQVSFGDTEDDRFGMSFPVFGGGTIGLSLKFRYSSQLNIWELFYNPHYNFIYLDLGLPELPIKKQNYQDIYYELSEIIRHELEHHWQKKQQHVETKSTGWKKTLESFIKYVSEPVERIARIKSAKYISKKTGKLFVDVLSKQYKILLRTAVLFDLSDDDIDKLVNRFVEEDLEISKQQNYLVQT